MRTITILISQGCFEWDKWDNIWEGAGKLLSAQKKCSCCFPSLELSSWKYMCLDICPWVKINKPLIQGLTSVLKGQLSQSGNGDLSCKTGAQMSTPHAHEAPCDTLWNKGKATSSHTSEPELLVSCLHSVCFRSPKHCLGSKSQSQNWKEKSLSHYLMLKPNNNGRMKTPYIYITCYSLKSTWPHFIILTTLWEGIIHILWFLLWGLKDSH